MAEIKVNVTSGKQQKVTVSSTQNSTEISASADTGRFWAQSAKNWAVSDVIVDNTDYSSKHYAKEAKENATTAKNYESSTRETYNSFLNASANALNELKTANEQSLENIEASRVDAVDSINTVKSEGIADIENKANEALTLVNNGITQINTTKNTAVDDINSTKTNILKDIEFVADGEKEEIQELADKAKDDIESTGFYMRDDKLYFINSNGEEEEFKSGGLEIGDIGFTQMAIDESKGKRRILNGQVIIQDQYVQFTNIVKDSVALNPSLACTEAEWQTEVTMNTFGLCGKFVIDDEGGTIRLPKYPNYFIAGLANIAPVVGNGMTLGLTNGKQNAGIVGSFGNYVICYPSLYGKPVGTPSSDPIISGSTSLGVTTDPTKSGIEAQINEKQITGQYFIQVATGAETEDNIINEIELNNPFSLLDYKYSEYELNNISWLRSEGQYNSKAVYPAVYDLLLKIYNGTETKAGVSVKLSIEDYTDYDFVLNTAEETFRLPIKVKLASGKAVAGNGMSLGLTDGTTTKYTYTATSGNNMWTYQPAFITSIQGRVGDSASGVLDHFVANKYIGITTDPTKSGLELSDSNLYLYFYVGETVQNANLINAGRIEEKVASLIPDNSSVIAGYAMPSSRATNLTLGASGTTYTAPANGWFVIRKRTAAANQGLFFGISNGVQFEIYNPVSGAIIGLAVPAKRGDVLNTSYSAGGATEMFRFIYAQGEV